VVETEVRPQRAHTGRLAFGIILVALGVVWLLAEYTNLDFSAWWPVLLMAPGVVFLGAALASSGGRRTGLLVASFQMLALGGLFWFQIATELWATWAYAWALIWPGSIGLAIWIGGSLAGDPDTAAGGRRTAIVGAVMFLVGFVFFEGVVGVSGGPIADIGDYALPIGLILVGAFVAFPALRRRR
jgi:hypothetical protein